MTTIQPVADHSIIVELIEHQAQAWNSGDSHAFASSFTAEGCFVNVLGAISYGRAPFEAQHEKIFTTIYKGSKIKLPIRRVLFLRHDVALVDIDAVLEDCVHLPPGLVSTDGIVRTRLQEVLVKEGDSWWVASFHNVDIKSPLAAA